MERHMIHNRTSSTWLCSREDIRDVMSFPLSRTTTILFFFVFSLLLDIQCENIEQVNLVTPPTLRYCVALNRESRFNRHQLWFLCF